MSLEIPGPRNYFKNMLGVQRRPLEFFSHIAREHGDVVRYPMGIWRDLFLITHPADIKHVLVTNNRNYTTQLRHRRMFKLAMGEGLFTSEGAHWLTSRRLMQPVFHRKSIAGLATIMLSTIEKKLDQWEAGQTIDISAVMTELTLEIIASCLFGVEIGQEVNEIGQTIAEMMELFARWIRSPAILFPVGLISPTQRRLKTTIRLMDQMIEKIIFKRRVDGENGENKDDLLSILMAAQDEETGQRFSDKQLRDEVRTMFFAGHETTATALTWAFYFLSQHPTVEQQLHQELLSSTGPLNAVNYDGLPVTRMIILETLRLYPPLWLIFRKALDQDVIGGYQIPAGSRITICPYLTHRRPDLWKEPDSFLPERFASQDRPSFAYFPFGGGPRQCIGKHFALLSAQLTLAAVAQRYKLHLVSEQHIEPLALLTIRPDKALLMRLEAKDESSHLISKKHQKYR